MNVSTMTRDQLRRLASEYNLYGRGSMRKADLVKAIEDFHNLDNAFIASGSVCALPTRATIAKDFGLPKPPTFLSNRYRKASRLARRASKLK
jgi:acetyl-CoA carboxylase alpha subunit